jgi:hypothetical protein
MSGSAAARRDDGCHRLAEARLSVSRGVSVGQLRAPASELRLLAMRTRTQVTCVPARLAYDGNRLSAIAAMWAYVDHGEVTVVPGRRYRIVREHGSRCSVTLAGVREKCSRPLVPPSDVSPEPGQPAWRTALTYGRGMGRVDPHHRVWARDHLGQLPADGRGATREASYTSSAFDVPTRRRACPAGGQPYPSSYHASALHLRAVGDRGQARAEDRE